MPSFELNSGGEVSWCVPPGGESPAFLEVWWPQEVEEQNVSLTVTAPNGPSLTASSHVGIYSVEGIRWSVTVVQRTGGLMALIALAPTFSHDAAPVAPHGRWQIQVKGAHGAAGQVHLYVARAHHNLGGKRWANSSYLYDEQESPNRAVRISELDEVDSKVRRSGTLNGIATGKNVKVAAGYIRSSGLPARYSSSGLSRGGRTGPDWALPTDESRDLPGVLAGGVRSGSVFRLIGTSTAAPQLARKLANGENLSILKGPTQDVRMGWGRLP